MVFGVWGFSLLEGIASRLISTNTCVMANHNDSYLTHNHTKKLRPKIPSVGSWDSRFKLNMMGIPLSSPVLPVLLLPCCFLVLFSLLFAFLSSPMSFRTASNSAVDGLQANAVAAGPPSRSSTPSLAAISNGMQQIPLTFATY